MVKIELDKVMLDNGWPDAGHYEYVLVKKEPRETQLGQFLLGYKETRLKYYGETSPSYKEVEQDILNHR